MTFTAFSAIQNYTHIQHTYNSWLFEFLMKTRYISLFEFLFLFNTQIWFTALYCIHCTCTYISYASYNHNYRSTLFPSFFAQSRIDFFDRSCVPNVAWRNLKVRRQSLSWLPSRIWSMTLSAQRLPWRLSASSDGKRTQFAPLDDLSSSFRAPNVLLRPINPRIQPTASSNLFIATLRAIVDNMAWPSVIVDKSAVLRQKKVEKLKLRQTASSTLFRVWVKKSRNGKKIAWTFYRTPKALKVMF